ncbi:MAG: hypothetical protein C4520_00855 [Candidatus Abyssobacteria bacterium SURF_5]|uniref:Uncharacterized protein n=1 Tax=Abyssobacteria bacterium (strain SURF_5) TaxID=2093360 RepID=A0A3A4PEC5_ABYX5|nr:MAG: hypothetical protein C4520_00855 [Candidatus Abyssubacteria bacterium SURF_5]
MGASRRAPTSAFIGVHLRIRNLVVSLLLCGKVQLFFSAQKSTFRYRILISKPSFACIGVHSRFE